MNDISNYHKAKLLYDELKENREEREKMWRSKSIEDLMKNKYFFMFLRNGLSEYIDEKEKDLKREIERL